MEPSTPQPTTKKPANILCIEDEQFIGELYKRALEKAGFTVTIVADGIKGLEAAKTNLYDIILLDIMVPGILGVEILSNLRRDVPNLKAKIIITTNLEQDPSAKKSAEEQADGYLIKADVTPRQMVEFVRQIKLSS